MNPDQPACFISSLPTELLCSIFQLSCVTSALKAKTDYSKRDNHNIMPIVVSHVSSYWRNAAVHFSLLWTRINITEGYPFQKTSIWLDRAGSSPLDISILQLRTYEDIQGLTDLLLPRVRQWRKFRMLIPEEPYLSSILLEEMLDGKKLMPLLEKLEIHDADDEYDDDPACWLDIAAPRLRTVIIRRVSWDGCLSLGNITRFIWEKPTVELHFDDLMFILSFMPALKKLEFSGQMDASPSEVIAELDSLPRETWPLVLPIQLNFLERLRLDYHGDACLEAWFWVRCIDAPKLVELDVRHAMFHGEGLSPELTLDDADRILHRNAAHTFPSLVKIHWDRSELCCRTSNLARYMDLSPSLQEIVIHWHQYWDTDSCDFEEFARKLMIENSWHPNLERIQFEDQSGPIFEYVKNLDRSAH